MQVWRFYVSMTADERLSYNRDARRAEVMRMTLTAVKRESDALSARLRHEFRRS